MLGRFLKERAGFKEQTCKDDGIDIDFTVLKPTKNVINGTHRQ